LLTRAVLMSRDLQYRDPSGSGVAINFFQRSTFPLRAEEQDFDLDTRKEELYK
jgi:hypothetical protein